jgi:hypothetical protein
MGRIANVKNDAGLHYHQHCTKCNEKAAEYKKVEGFPEHWLE